MVTRRDVLIGAGSRTTAAAADCLSQSPGAGGGQGAYTDCLGPKMADVQFVVYR